LCVCEFECFFRQQHGLYHSLSWERLRFFWLWSLSSVYFPFFPFFFPFLIFFSRQEMMCLRRKDTNFPKRRKQEQLLLDACSRFHFRNFFSKFLFIFHFYQDGVVLGADTRATEDTIVCDKNCEKIHYIAPNIYCCGAGTSADTENTTGFQTLSQFPSFPFLTLLQRID